MLRSSATANDNKVKRNVMANTRTGIPITRGLLRSGAGSECVAGSECINVASTVAAHTALVVGRECAPDSLNVQVLHVQRVVFDKLSAGFDVFAHQGSEDGFTLGDVFESNLQEGTTLGIHGRFPELLGGHFSEAFVALDDVLFAAFVQDVIEELAGGVLLDYLRIFHSARSGLAGSLLGLLGFFGFRGT